MDSHKRLFLIIIILSFFLFAQVSFAQSDSNMTLQDDSHDELSVGESNDLHESDAKNKTVFIISDNPGTNIIDSAWVRRSFTPCLTNPMRSSGNGSVRMSIPFSQSFWENILNCPIRNCF